VIQVSNKTVSQITVRSLLPLLESNHQLPNLFDGGIDTLSAPVASALAAEFVVYLVTRIEAVRS